MNRHMLEAPWLRESGDFNPSQMAPGESPVSGEKQTSFRDGSPLCLCLNTPTAPLAK